MRGRSWGTVRRARALVVALAAGAVVLASSAPAGAAGAAQARPDQVLPTDVTPLCGTEAGADGAFHGRGPVRIADFNILHSLEDISNETIEQRIELMADVLAASGADAMGLQEVVQSANHGRVAQRLAAGLAGRTGDDWHWCWSQSNPHVPGEPDTGPGGVGGPLSAVAATQARAGDSPWADGIAILSRYPITTSAAHRLAPRGWEAPACVAEHPDDVFAGPTCVLDTRQVLWARIESSCGGLDLFTSHLAHHLSSQSETVQQVQITDALLTIDRLATPDRLPDVYVGDFNTTEDSPVHQAVLDAGFVDSYRVDHPTSPGYTADQDIVAPTSTVSERIDYVFARPGTAPFEPQGSEVIGDAPAPRLGGEPGDVVWPSDHYGVAVTLGVGDACRGAAPAPAADAAAGSAADVEGRVVGRSAAPPARLPATGAPVAPVATLLLLAWAAARALRWLRTPT